VRTFNRSSRRWLESKADLTPGPNLFQYVRSTRETERAEEYPMHVVGAWIGNSKAVATKH
jgi:hypothetical protein